MGMVTCPNKLINKVFKNRLAKMCPTVPGHIVPPKTSTPRSTVHHDLVSSATVTQRNMSLRSQAHSNNSSRPNSANTNPATNNENNATGNSARKASTNLRPGLRSGTINGTTKSSSSASSSASSLTHQQQQQSTSYSPVISKIKSPVIEEVGGITPRLSNKRLMSARFPDGKTPKLNKTQRSNSIASTGPLISLKNQHPHLLPTSSSNGINGRNAPTTAKRNRVENVISPTSNHRGGAGADVMRQQQAPSSASSNGSANGVTTRSNALRAKNQENLLQELASLQERLQEVESLNRNYEAEKQELKSKIENLKESHRGEVVRFVEQLEQKNGEIERIKRLHEAEISSKDAQVCKLEQELITFVTDHDREREYHKEELKSLIKDFAKEKDELESEFTSRIQSLKASHEFHVEEIRKAHQKEMEQHEKRHCREIELLKKKHADNLAEHKKEIPDDILHKEIESLQVVLELRADQIKEQQRELLEYKLRNEELQSICEKNKGLLAKVEDLEAQIQKTRTDRNKILEKCNVMETSMSQIVNENDRLHLFNEELAWKIETLQTSEHYASSSDASEGGTLTPTKLSNLDRQHHSE